MKYCRKSEKRLIVLCNEVSCVRTHLNRQEYNKLIFDGDPSVGKATNRLKEPISTELMSKIFQNWKESNALYEAAGLNKNPLPGQITEHLVAHAFNAKVIKKGSGDLMTSKGEIIEVKGSSSVGPNSFSPNSNFDNLIYVYYSHLDEHFYIYVLNMKPEDLEKIVINSKETFKNQADAGRRPRFSIMKEIVKKKNLSYHTKISLSAVAS